MSGYRLGDMVKYTSMRDGKRGKDWHIRTYPKSIAAEYLRRTTGEDLDVLTNVVTEKSHGKKMEGIAIHLRVGDVIEHSASSEEDFASRPTYFHHSGNRDQYTPCWSNIKKCLEKIETSQKDVTIFAAAHTNEKNFSKSCRYISIIQNRLEKNGYNVTRRLGGNPDEDFILMTTAPYFIQSGGGYSQLIRQVRKKLGLPSCKATL